jgi:hypothetical protein
VFHVLDTKDVHAVRTDLSFTGRSLQLKLTNLINIGTMKGRPKMPLYAFGTYDGIGLMDLFWVEEHNSDRDAVDAAVKSLADAFPDHEIRSATSDDEDDGHFVVRVDDDFPVDADKLSSTGDRYEIVGEVYQGLGIGNVR